MSPPSPTQLWEHAKHLLTFAKRSPLAGVGARWLDNCGMPEAAAPIHTWITARMTHVFAMGAQLGVPGAAALAQAAMSGLTGPLHDRVHGGWFAEVGATVPAAGKSCYDHAFVVLAASSAVHAELDGASQLFDEATTTFERHFWDDSVGLCVDRWDDRFESLDPYRGLNANMHAVEAMLAAASVTADPVWIARANSVAAFVVEQAERHNFRLPEHYDEKWRPVLDFNRDRPEDPFRPYGATVGHGFEWSRLLINLDDASPTSPLRWRSSAAALFERAALDGWERDGQPGFVYTTDWSGTPVVRERLHWVAAEAVAAACVLQQRTDQAPYATRYQQWWEYIATYLIDSSHGSWHHELDAENRPAATVWSGKPDIYHAFQATLLPLLEPSPTLSAPTLRTPATETPPS